MKKMDFYTVALQHAIKIHAAETFKKTAGL